MNFMWYYYRITEYHSVKMWLKDSQLDKLKAAAKNVIGVTLGSQSDMIGTDENNFPHNLLLTDRQGASLCKASENDSMK